MNWRLIGTLATVAGGALTLLTSKVEEEKMKETVRKEVKEQLSQQQNSLEEEL